jgi:hypothetical protein
MDDIMESGSEKIDLYERDRKREEGVIAVDTWGETDTLICWSSLGSVRWSPFYFGCGPQTHKLVRTQG